MKILKNIIYMIPCVLISYSLSAVENYAVVNSQEVILSSKAYASFSTQMEKYKNEFETTLVKEQESLKKIEQDLLNKRADYSSNEFEKRKKDLDNKVRIFREKVQTTNQKFEQTGQEVSKAITDSARQAIAEIVSSKKYEVVFESMALLNYPPEKDITKEVLKKLDAKLPKVTVKKPF